ncbi:MAG: sigma-54 dependent transcriptional regulator [Verrucomicrobiae bacterium]|nr:sigma-54 dependent transcriptional regulator [Verrucomicrobiae bacterium]
MNSPALRILLVEDDPASLHLLERWVEVEGFEIGKAASVEEAEKVMGSFGPHVILTDILLPGRDGFALLTKVRHEQLPMEVILLTGHASVERAVEAIREGACDYIEKPVQRSRLQAALHKARQQILLRLENLELRHRLAAQASELLVGQSAVMREIRGGIERSAAGDMNVLIEGESGTGKEVAAELIHQLSPRASQPLIKISCAAIPENLLESEMFGYEKGAFTGAGQAKAGKFELAHRGTLFLDEVGEMSPSLQAKLLRVLQDGRFARLGGNEVKAVDVRVVSATNVDVEKAIADGRFREDLYYRLNVVRLKMPPLRDRLDDVPLLVEHFLAQLRRKLNLPEMEVSEEAMAKLKSCRWPGNVRQLANAVERAMAFRQGRVLEAADFVMDEIPSQPVVKSGGAEGKRSLVFELGMPLDEVERRMIHAAMESCDGDKEKAAVLLGISARTIYRKLGLPNG